ncbi:unnamed protein product, partial [Ectocarpus sp. 13 AM-2016]
GSFRPTVPQGAQVNFHREPRPLHTCRQSTPRIYPKQNSTPPTASKLFPHSNTFITPRYFYVRVFRRPGWCVSAARWAQHKGLLQTPYLHQSLIQPCTCRHHHADHSKRTEIKGKARSKPWLGSHARTAR